MERPIQIPQTDVARFHIARAGLEVKAARESAREGKKEEVETHIGNVISATTTALKLDPNVEPWLLP